MRQATIEDIEHISKLLSRAYINNPTVDLLFKSAPTEKEKQSLFNHLIEEQILLERVYLTDNGLGVAVYHRSQFAVKKWVKSTLLRLRVVLGVSGIKRGIAAMRRQKKVAARRKNNPHIFFWILAVDPDNRGLETIIEIRDHIFELSRKYQIPVYAETPLERTKNLYVRYGFQVYDEVNFKEGYTIYMLERNPD